MRVLTAIPVYNEQDHIEPILREVLRYADDVLVVDDGSTDGTPDRLRHFPQVQVIRHPKNRGYGAGLQSAFQRTIEGGYDGLVTLDCDGQHEPVRIPEVAAPSTATTSSRAAATSRCSTPRKARPRRVARSTARSPAGSTSGSG